MNTKGFLAVIWVSMFSFTAISEAQTMKNGGFERQTAKYRPHRRLYCHG